MQILVGADIFVTNLEMGNPAEFSIEPGKASVRIRDQPWRSEFFTTSKAIEIAEFHTDSEFEGFILDEE